MAAIANIDTKNNTDKNLNHAIIKRECQMGIPRSFQDLEER